MAGRKVASVAAEAKTVQWENGDILGPCMFGGGGYLINPAMSSTKEDMAGIEL